MEQNSSQDKSSTHNYKQISLHCTFSPCSFSKVLDLEKKLYDSVFTHNESRCVPVTSFLQSHSTTLSTTQCSKSPWLLQLHSNAMIQVQRCNHDLGIIMPSAIISFCSSSLEHTRCLVSFDLHSPPGSTLNPISSSNLFPICSQLCYDSHRTFLC